MFTKEEIYATYNQYKIDLKVNSCPEKILILPIKMSETIAMINSVDYDFFELYINEDMFYYKNLPKEYLQQILYHEFTHVIDRLTYFKDIKDEKKHRNILFAYTEFHAAQIEMKKRLNLFLNNNEVIDLNIKIQGEHNVITLNDFLKSEYTEFTILKDRLIENPNINNVQNIIYVMLYNIGYYSVLKKYKINNNISFSVFYQDISKNLQCLKNILLNDKPSEELCKKTSTISLEIAKKIAQQYNIL